MDVVVAVTDRKTCQNMILELKSIGIHDSRYPVQKLDGNMLGIPIKNDLEIVKKYLVSDNKYEIQGKPFYLKKCDEVFLVAASTTPAAKLKTNVKQLLDKKNVPISAEVEREIPEKWEKYGDTVIFGNDKSFESDVWQSRVGNELWLVVCDTLKVNRVAIRKRIKSDCYRTPRAELVWGNSSWVTHTDNGIKYSWNVEKNMFCAGNAPERHRVAGFDCREEVVVDMYAGIGYFTLPYIIHAGAKTVHACEWNPDAVVALRYNLSQNNIVEKCVIHEGDNRVVCPVGVANRVNLGLLPSSKKAWKTACAALNPVSGGVLHLHENVTSGKPKITHEATGNFDKDLEKQTCMNSNCNTCVQLISTLSKQEETFCDACSTSFCLQSDNMKSQVLNNINFRWKKVEWKMWALHTCHTICTLLHTIHGQNHPWEVSVQCLHHVKSYAPHVDHLVLDLKCIPLIGSV
ncbi:tRNA wybutosine-synthesizing protein 2 homolog [Schistocerca americana]|uniref:tRNA wybutosine-synthesizing protein 2 homolog n=1 Tax=Schistocerca americana TaxID=7009 RepID=UPI001F4F349B|nr:tRNA wybutosine-synthesizing protein 2 homolog [Schistocerca americana]